MTNENKPNITLTTSGEPRQTQSNHYHLEHLLKEDGFQYNLHRTETHDLSNDNIGQFTGLAFLNDDNNKVLKAREQMTELLKTSDAFKDANLNNEVFALDVKGTLNLVFSFKAAETLNDIIRDANKNIGNALSS